MQEDATLEEVGVLTEMHRIHLEDATLEETGVPTETHRIPLEDAVLEETGFLTETHRIHLGGVIGILQRSHLDGVMTKIALRSHQDGAMVMLEKHHRGGEKVVKGAQEI